VTALCSGGASAPKAGVEEFLTWSAGGAQLAQLRWGSWYAVGLLTLVGFLPIITDEFCATDPPPIVDLTEDELLALYGRQFGTNWLSGLAKLKDSVLNVIWHEICECTSVATPALPAAPTAPSNLPVVNPGYPTSNYTCFELGPIHVSSVNGTYTQQYGPFQFPPGMVSYKIWFDNAVNDALGRSYTLARSPGTVFASAPTIAPTTGPSADGLHESTNEIAVVGPGQNYWLASLNGSAGTTTVDISIVGVCQGAGTGLPGSEQSCLTDPAVMSLLSELLELVTLIQRQAVPFAYVPGAAHTGLSGTGELSVSGLIGARITVTDSNVFDIGTEEGTPDVLWTHSWFNWGSADGYTPREFLSSESTLSLPSRAGAFTKLAYSLAPGVVVTIEELEREP
jgi:hypothetical protein